MKIFVGLGNPGAEYEKTYHNAGFLALESLMLAKSKALSLPGMNPQTLAQPVVWKKYKNLFEYTENQDGDAVFVRPLTYMNESGRAVREAMKRFKAEPKDLVVLHDDSDLTIGTYKIAIARNAAGHHGVESIIDSLKTKSFTRIRIGIRPAQETKRQKAGEFALKQITVSDQKTLKAVFDQITRDISAPKSRSRSSIRS